MSGPRKVHFNGSLEDPALIVIVFSSRVLPNDTIVYPLPSWRVHSVMD